MAYICIHLLGRKLFPKNLSQSLPKNTTLDIILYRKSNIPLRSPKTEQFPLAIANSIHAFLVDIISPQPFDQRRSILQKLNEQQKITVAKYIHCTGNEHFINFLQTEFSKSESVATDGVLIVRPKSYYHMQEYKSFFVKNSGICTAVVQRANVHQKVIIAEEDGSEVKIKYSEKHIPILSGISTGKKICYTSNTKKLLFIYPTADKEL